MKPNVHRSDRIAARSGWRSPVLRCGVLIVAAASAGCSNDVVMQNPRTGMTGICQESVRGFDPWSQKMACVASHEAQGWIRVDRE
jgi:hypothetical protein